MLIGLTGCKGSGKDTAASFLDGYTKLAFADKMKEAVGALFDVEYDDTFKSLGLVTYEVRGYAKPYYQHVSMYGREFLQRFGTEMGRHTFGENFWVDQWARQYDQIDGRNVVVPDVRFPNEAARIHFYGGVIIEIKRPGHDPDGHASEEPLDADLIDGTVVNDGTIEQFCRRFMARVEALEYGVVST